MSLLLSLRFSCLRISGCVTQLTEQKKKAYNKRTEEFKICADGEKCNRQQFLVTCLVCNSTVNPDCATSPNASLYSKTCDGYKNMCFTWISPRNVIRGCINDIKEFNSVQCAHDKNRCGYCSSNDGIGCNDAPIDTDTCIECDSTEDNKCRLNPSILDQRLCAHIKSARRKGCYLSIVSEIIFKHFSFPFSSFCFWFFFLFFLFFFFFFSFFMRVNIKFIIKKNANFQDGDHVKRGCIQDLTPSEGQECLNGTETCKSCEWSNCNTKTSFQECYNCNSKNDRRCSRGVQSAKKEVCKTYYSACIIGIDKEGYTHRGCSMDYKDMMHGFSHRYDNCAENNCNSQIFPEDRLKCYQCNGEESCNFMSPDSTDVNLQPQPCGISSDFDQCFTYINKGSVQVI